MTEPKPLIPPFQQGDDSIDAADPGPGAPGSISDGDAEVTPEELEAFEKKMDEERKGPQLFRTPHPDHHQDQ